MTTASGLVYQVVRQIEGHGLLLAVFALAVLAVALAGAVMIGDLLPPASEAELMGPARWYPHHA